MRPPLTEKCAFVTSLSVHAAQHQSYRRRERLPVNAWRPRHAEKKTTSPWLKLIIENSTQT